MVNNYGFYIEKLILVNGDVEPAVIEFKKGLNVVYGASDTGKTFIFQCIQYLLGKSDIPKRIPESEKYSTGFLQIRTYTNEVYTLERLLSGSNDIKVYSTDYNAKHDDTEFLSCNISDFSDFLLNTCNIGNKKARKNKKGHTKNITFRMLQHFFFMNETELQEEMSPIQKDQYTDKTYLENIFKFLLTEIDDGDTAIVTDQAVITKKNLRLELLNEDITLIQDEISEYTDSPKEIETQLTKLLENIETIKDEHLLLKESHKEHQNKIMRIDAELREIKARYGYLDGLLKRGEVLQEQYNSDIQRLKSLIETSESLQLLEASKCPLCNSDIEEEIDINNVVLSSNFEIEKILALKKELEETLVMFKSEQEELSKSQTQKEDDRDTILETLTDSIEALLVSKQMQLENLYDKKAKLTTVKHLNSKLEQIKSSKKQIETFIERTKENNSVEYQSLDTVVVKPLINKIKHILKAINFPELESVDYSEDKKDIIIDDKHRQAFGKGYRAILYTVFILALVELLKNKSFQIGFAIFDSPMVTFKDVLTESSDDGISNDLAQNLYNYIADNFQDIQIIILENTEPPQNPNINTITFTKNKEFGRYGFIPLN